MILSDKFVCEDRERSTYFKHVAAPIFRKSFTVPEHIKRAEISICGIGFYDLFVNGRKITKGYLAPYISNPDHITYYDLYDIKPYFAERRKCNRYNARRRFRKQQNMRMGF